MECKWELTQTELSRNKRAASYSSDLPQLSPSLLFSEKDTEKWWWEEVLHSELTNLSVIRMTATQAPGHKQKYLFYFDWLPVEIINKM